MRSIFKLSSGLFFTAILILLLSSCGDTSSSSKTDVKTYKYASMKDGVLHLDLDKSRRDSSILNMSDICDSLIYIPLETTKECLLGNNIKNLLIDGDDVFILVKGELFHFNINGEFLGQIGSKGRAAGEFYCGGFCLNKVDKQLVVKAMYKGKLLEYDYNGKLLSEKITLRDGIPNMFYNSLRKSIEYTSFYTLSENKDFKKDFNILSEIALDGSSKSAISSKFFPDKYFRGQMTFGLITSGASMYKFNGDLFVNELASDTIFKKEGDSLSPHIVLNNYSWRLPFSSNDYEKEARGRVIWMMSSHSSFPTRVSGESERFVFLDLFSEPSYIYDKDARNLSCIKSFVNEDDRMIVFNDIDGLNHFKAMKLVKNEFLYEYKDALSLIDSMNKLKESSGSINRYTKQLKHISLSLNEESNPILILARLKNSYYETN